MAVLFAEDEGDGTLLDSETDGLAIDFTDTDDYVRSTWAMESVQERNSSVDTLQSPHVFFTQSGTSPKYVKNSSTTIGWSPHNLCLQSQTFTTTWDDNDGTTSADTTVAPDGTTTGDTYTQGASGQINQVSITVLSGAQYTASIYAKQGTATWVRFHFETTSNTNLAWFNLSTGAVGTVSLGSASIESMGSGWYRLSISGLTGGTSATVEFIAATGDNSHTRDNGKTAVLWGAQLNRGHTPTAYIATTTAAKIGLPISYGEGLLVEPAATNLYLRSQEADNAYWTKTNSSIAANSTAAPDGSTTADTLTSTSTSNARYGVNVTGLTNDGTHTHSVYAKAGTASWLALVSQYAGDGSSTATWFNLGSGTVGTVQSQITSASITSVGDGWYRCSHTYTNGTGASTTHEIYVTDGDNTGNVTNGVNIYVWGAQLEAGAVATSYVPTVAASATRAADHVNVAVSTFPYSQSTQSAYGHFISRLINHTGSALRLVEIDDGTNNERIIVASDLTPNPDEGNLFIVDGGATQVSANAGQLSLAGNKIAAAWSLNNSGIVMDGSAETTDTSCTMPTVTTMRVGSDRTPAGPINGFLRNLVLVPRRMTEAEMQGKTA
jgi:hypothetical protein